ncbi:MAG: hypothetical protein ACYC6T_17675 [Thermoleophilia bacterium]
MDTRPLERLEFDAGMLMSRHPPEWRNENKRLVFEIADNSGFPHEGTVRFARWREEQPPTALTAQPQFSVRLGAFDYLGPPDATTIPWYLNFADPELFFAYGSALLAQDELQVAEHPILASLRGALVQAGRQARTVDEQGKPTPVTITGVQRRCVIDTTPDPTAGRPGGLYGNAFARAPSENIRSATTPLTPPTISNILAIAAPAGGRGQYSREEMLYVLNAAYSGFAAARQESERLVPASARALIHTGFWGCGAFGGNRTLMTILQALAADLADVDLVFHSLDRPGVELAELARARFERLRDSALSVSDLVDGLLGPGSEWGTPDGT